MDDENATKTPGVMIELDTPGLLQPATTLGLGLPAHVSGLPAFYYWKDAIVVGSYVHPTQQYSLKITREKLDGYANTFRQMQRNGVGVPILMDHAQSAASTLGWIVDMKRRGDRLMELHQFLGKQARDIGLRNKVSLGIDPNFIDGKGNRYGEAVVHSAITPVPVVPGQQGFESAEPATMCHGRQVMKLSLAMEDAGAAAVSADEPADPQPQMLEVPAPTPTPTPTPASTHEAPAELNVALSMMADAAGVKRDLAVARGGITPAVADELYQLLVQSSNGNLNLLTLSRGSQPVPLALAVFEALTKNRPTPSGEQTALQVLSRQVPGTEALSELQQRMISLASGG